MFIAAETFAWMRNGRRSCAQALAMPPARCRHVGSRISLFGCQVC